MAMASALLSFMVACSLQHQGAVIRCYQCNSVNNSMCLDPSSYDEETTRKYLRPTSCEQGDYTPRPRSFFCRKIVQTILHKDHDPEVRVTRGCGWVRHHRDCYKADTDDHLATVCQCFSDQCNGTTHHQYTLSILVTTVWLMGTTQRHTDL